jgi:hypothetical protein
VTYDSHVVRNERDYKRIEPPPPPPPPPPPSPRPLILPWPVPSQNSFEKNKHIYICSTIWTEHRSVESSPPIKAKIHKNIHQSPEGDPNPISHLWSGPSSYTQIQSSEGLARCTVVTCLTVVTSAQITSLLRIYKHRLYCYDFRPSYRLIWSTSVLILSE